MLVRAASSAALLSLSIFALYNSTAITNLFEMVEEDSSDDQPDYSRIRVSQETLADLKELEASVYGSSSEISHEGMIMKLIERFSKYRY